MPASSHPAPALPRDAHLRVLAALMAAVSLPLLAILVLTPVAIGRILIFPEELPDDEVGVALVVYPFCLLLGLYGLGQALVARGLWLRRAWAGGPAAIVCVSWVAVGLIPLSAYGAFALFRPAVREAWWK